MAAPDVRDGCGDARAKRTTLGYASGRLEPRCIMCPFEYKDPAASFIKHTEQFGERGWCTEMRKDGNSIRHPNGIKEATDILLQHNTSTVGKCTTELHERAFDASARKSSRITRGHPSEAPATESFCQAFSPCPPSKLRQSDGARAAFLLKE